MSTVLENVKLLAPHAGDCCSLATAPLSADDAEQMAGRLKALSDPTRLRVLSHVAAQGCDAVCACDLTETLDISQPTISHHLKKLVEAGLLTREQRGKWAHYTVVREAFAELRQFLALD
ncbi:metalloregulator ArsR/SmtB family transcription factor [Brevibacterium daeguense]|uniref:Metalloregulator ArsR/SmtB family transcription factor n=1 Tax=Brevibacterium daeguense TaxID=909936 RepID=A0ABP8EHR2_9MICO|nr:metalloregulator ArsR/SmtB family transcription factor [Brevibacterium daeguense]